MHDPAVPMPVSEIMAAFVLHELAQAQGASLPDPSPGRASWVLMIGNGHLRDASGVPSAIEHDSAVEIYVSPCTDVILGGLVVHEQVRLAARGLAAGRPSLVGNARGVVEQLVGGGDFVGPVPIPGRG